MSAREGIASGDPSSSHAQERVRRLSGGGQALLGVVVLVCAAGVVFAEAELRIAAGVAATLASAALWTLSRALQAQDELFTALRHRSLRLRAELAEERDCMADLVEESPCLVVALDERGICRFVNAATEETTGYPHYTLIGQPWWPRLYPGERFEQVKALFRDLAKREPGEKRAYEMELLNAHGQPKRVLWRGFHGRDPETGDPVRYSLGIDLTDKLQAMDALKEAKLAAEAANRAKSEFLANMSHEIRTPLNGVVGNLELLEAHVEGEPEARELVTVASDSAHALLRIIDDVLDIAKVEAGRMTVEAIAFDLGALVRQVVELYRPRAEEKGLTLRSAVEEEDGAYRKGDPTRIRQVLSNLVSNAVKFTPEGGEVTVRSMAAAEGVALSVEDTGIGIPTDKLEAIFEAFEQADTSTTRRFGGTGLGLAISRQLCRLMSGELRVESAEGAGSRFHVELPLPVSLTLPQASPSPSPPISADARPLIVLLVDDNPTNIAVGRRMLERLGHTVLVATNGLEATQIYLGRRCDIDLVLMDIQMPVMDGVEATRALRSELGEAMAPVVALTAHAMRGDREKYLAAGMTDYMTKPVTLEKLREMLGRWAS